MPAIFMDAEHWMVASAERGPSPRPSLHTSRESAEREAARLAREHREDAFIVYHSVAKVQAVDVQVTRFAPTEPPF